MRRRRSRRRRGRRRRCGGRRGRCGRRRRGAAGRRVGDRGATSGDGRGDDHARKDRSESLVHFESPPFAVLVAWSESTRHAYGACKKSLATSCGAVGAGYPPNHVRARATGDTRAPVRRCDHLARCSRRVRLPGEHFWIANLNHPREDAEPRCDRRRSPWAFGPESNCLCTRTEADVRLRVRFSGAAVGHDLRRDDARDRRALPRRACRCAADPAHRGVSGAARACLDPRQAVRQLARPGQRTCRLRGHALRFAHDGSHRPSRRWGEQQSRRVACRSNRDGSVCVMRPLHAGEQMVGLDRRVQDRRHGPAGCGRAVRAPYGLAYYPGTGHLLAT